MGEQAAMHHDEGALDGVSALNGAPAAALRRLSEAAEWRDLRPGQAFELDENTCLACVEGRLRVIAGAQFHDVRAGEALFLERAAAGEETPSAAGAAIEPAVFAAIPFYAIMDELAPGRGLASTLTRWFARRLCRAAPDRANPSRKLYAALAMMAVPNGADGHWRIERMPRHREMADMSGMSEEGAANAVAHLISLGVAQRDYPGMKIIDFEALSRLAAA